MPREFNITTSVSTVTLDATRRGEIAFTVSNALDTRIRALASLQLSPPLKPEWLSLRGDEERDMPAGSTEVFLVDIQLPPDAPRGPFTFRFVVADEALPDERFTEGPAVSVELSVPAPAPARPFPWGWLVLGALVLSGTVAAAVVLRDKPQRVVAPQCASGQTVCEGQCVDAQSDARNCGRCGKACDEHFSCREGQCVRTGCPAGQTLCAGVCIDAQSDPRNCGACGTVCEEGLQCRDGRCSCPGALSACGGRCVNTTLDEENCGGCGIVCGKNESCQNGTCECGPGLTRCFNQCANLQSSTQHCGSCNNLCPIGKRCRLGSCVSPSVNEGGCPAGMIWCTCLQKCLPSKDCSIFCARPELERPGLDIELNPR